MVYKLSPRGKFVAHQSLGHSDPVLSVDSYTKVDETNKKLENVVVFLLENNKLDYFQFNGYIFSRICADNTVTIGGNPTTFKTSKSPGSTFTIKSDGSAGSFISSAFSFDDAASALQEEFHSNSENIRNLMSEIDQEWVNQGVEDLYGEFLLKAKKPPVDNGNLIDEDANAIYVDDITFSSPVKVDKITVESDDTSFKVGDKTILNSALLTDLIDINQDFRSVDADMISLKKTLEKGLKTDADAKLSQDLIFQDLKSNGKLSTDELIIEIEDSNKRKVVSANPSSTHYDLVEYMSNSINTDTSASSSPITVDSEVEFTNLVFEDKYRIAQIDGELTNNYFHNDVKGGYASGNLGKRYVDH